ncbi:zinc-finger-containing protein [Bradyrhizobium cenepequi]
MTEPAPLCCGVDARLTDGREIYPRRTDLHHKLLYKCDRCGAYCGCHPGTTKSLGTPANAETRRARSDFHDQVFDPLWKTAVITGGYTVRDEREANRIRKAARNRLYVYLANHLGISRDDCHTGMFTVDQVRRATEILKNVTYPDIRAWHRALYKSKGRAA